MNLSGPDTGGIDLANLKLGLGTRNDAGGPGHGQQHWHSVLEAPKLAGSWMGPEGLSAHPTRDQRV